MKKLAYIIFVMIVFNGCQKKETQRYFNDSPEIQTTKKVIEYYATYNYDGLKEIYSDSAKIYDNSVDPITITQMIHDIKANEDLIESAKVRDSSKYEMVITNDGETWVNSWYTVIFKFKGLDKDMSLPCHSTFQYKDGKIVKEYSYYNIHPIYQEFEKMNNPSVLDTLTTE